MQKKLAVQTHKAAELGGPYSQAIIYNGLIFISGQGAVDPLTNQVKSSTIENETRLTLDNIQRIMAEAGASLHNILQVSAYLIDIREYGRFNSIYGEYFEDPMPARTCVQVKRLPFGLRVEMDAVGYV